MSLDITKLLGLAPQNIAADLQPLLTELGNQIDASGTTLLNQVQAIVNSGLGQLTTLVQSIPLAQASEIDMDVLIAGTIPLKGTITLRTTEKQS